MTGPRRPRPGPVDPPAFPPAYPPGGPVPAHDPDRPLPVGLVALGLAAIVLIAVIGAAVSVLLTPVRIGTVLVPVAVVVSVALNIALPVLTFAITGSRAAGSLPVLVFFVAGWALSISPNGDVLLAGGSNGQTAISYATLLLAVLAGAVTTIRLR